MRNTPHRRRWAVAVAVGVLLLVAGCSAAGPTPAGGVSDAAATATADPAASAGAALNGDVKAVCEQATRSGTAFGQTYLADLKLRLDAAEQGPQAKSQAERKIDQDVQNYSSELAGLAKRTGDPALKKALTQMSKQVTALKGDLTKINAEKMSVLSGTLDKACGRS